MLPLYVNKNRPLEKVFTKKRTAMEENSDEGSTLKVILVGYSGVGKTSLINSYFDQPEALNTSPTVAPAFCSSKITLKNGKNVVLHIWDTAGQERFQSIGQMFYRDSDIAFVCFDKTTENTIGEWIKRVLDQVSTCKIFLVLTKSDLLSNEEMSQMKAKSNILKEQHHATEFFITSSTTLNGVKELYYAAATLASEKEQMPGEILVLQSAQAKPKKCC